MIIPIISKLAAESLLSLYPIFVKKIGISLTLQMWTRLISYVAISAIFIDLDFIKSSLTSLDSLTLGLVNLSHIFFSYEGFRNLDSGVSFAIFNTYPLMILLLSGLKWNNAYLLMILGLAFFIYDNFSSKEAMSVDDKKSTEPMNFTYGITMIILAALTEAFIYFLVRRVKTDNHWNHVFISYFLGAVFMTLYISNENQFSIAKIFKSLNNTRVGVAAALNGLIGSVGYFLRFFASYRLDAGIYSVLSYFGIIMSYIYGMAFNAEKLTWPKVAGTISIIGANYFS